MNNSAVKTVPQILKDNICTMFNLLNLLIVIALAMVGAWKNTLFFLVIVINTAVGIVQEIKAKRQIERLTLLALPKVTVLRDGDKADISPEEVRKGDVLLLQSGGVVCCDCKLLSGAAEINESILTGESEPVQKQPGDTLLAGSSVVSGRCRAEVICDHADSFTARIPDESISRVAARFTVFGRVTPKQKKLLVAALQKEGHKVAMTGDGVNDLLAMRQADCSAAMGAGCDAAKQTAQLVLLDSDFSVLKDVIAEGRRVINNLTKSAGVFFIKTIYSVLLCILCLCFNTDFPFIPIQITLIDAVIEAFPAFFMSFEKNEQKCGKSFLRTAVSAALPNGIAVFVCCAILLVIQKYAQIDHAQSVLLMYLSVGFISLAGVAKARLPFNLLRGTLLVLSVFGFVCALLLFSNLLQLPHLSWMGAMMLPAITVFGLVLSVCIKETVMKGAV